MKKLIIALALTAFTTGCGRALEDFVRVNRPKSGAADGTDDQLANSIKVSPGQTQATGGDVAMTAHVTITDRSLDGGDVSAKVTVNRTRQD